MTYYSEAPPPVPALPKEIQQYGTPPSRGGSQNGSIPRLKRRPLPQQPDLGGLGRPPSRGVAREPYDQLPPPTSHSTHSSLDIARFRPDPYDDMRFENDPRHPRNRSVDYAIPRHPAAYDRSYEYPHYDPPPSPSLGRHRSEASLRTQYYEIRPLQEVENMHYPAVNDIREEAHRPRTSLPLPNEYDNPYVDPVRDDCNRPRTSLPHTDPRMYPRPVDPSRDEVRRPRTSLPLPNEPQLYRDDRPVTSSNRYRQPQRRESLDNYYNTPPPEEHPPIPVRPESITRLYEQSEEVLPVQPFRRESSLAPPLPTQTYSPKAIPPPISSPHTTPQRTYSPHTAQTLATPPTYSPAPPPHRTPPSRSTPSPRTPLNGPSPHPSPHVPLKKPSPVRAIDHLPPSSYAPEHTPPSQRRPLPTPPVANSSPSEYSQASSPLAYRAPELPAKIPLGMTEQEYWALGEAEEPELGAVEVRYRGLDGEWKAMRDNLPEVGYRR